MEREIGDGLRTSSLQGASSSGVSDLNQPLHCCGFLDLGLKLDFNTSHGVKQKSDSQYQKGLGQSPCPALCRPLPSTPGTQRGTESPGAHILAQPEAPCPLPNSDRRKEQRLWSQVLL